MCIRDRSYTRNNFECVQGWVTAEKVGTGDATLRVLKGSHKLHGEFAAAFDKKVLAEDDTSTRRKKRADWYKLSDAEIQWYLDKGCEVVDVECDAGSQVLWDSRTVHSGKCPTHGRPVARNRYVVYTSYLPQCNMNAKRAAKKRKIVLEGRMTTHWADARKMFPKHPYTRGSPLITMPPYKRPRLTKRGAELFGWSDVSTSSCPFVAADDPPAAAAGATTTESAAAAAATAVV